MGNFPIRSRPAIVAGAMMVAACAAGVLGQQPPNNLPNASPTPAPLPVFTPYHASGIYNIGDKAGWNVTLPEGAAAPSAPYTYTVSINDANIVKRGEIDLSSGKTTLDIPSDAPEMIFVQLTPPGGGGGGRGRGFGGAGGGGGARGRGGISPYSLRLGAAIAPTKLEPTAPKPADFDAFWEGKLKALDAIPINPQLTEAPHDPAGQKEYMVKLDSVDSHVQGFLARPDKEGKFPALILYQYAGVYALPEHNVTDRAAQGWLCMDVDSHDVQPNSTQGVPQGYASVGNTDREKCYFLDMYLRDTRAVQYIKSRPDWDGKTLVLMGTSMGGQQTLVTAGLNDGITAALAWVPSGTDFDGTLHGHRGGYPNWNARDPKVAETGLYFDVVNFAPRIKAPTFIAMGFLDEIASPVGIWTAYDQIPGNKEIIPMPRAAHNNEAPPETERAWATRSEELLKTLVEGGQVTPKGTPAAQ